MLKRCVVALVVFFGGAGCIVLSVNLKSTYGSVRYDASANGTVTYIPPLATSFEYAYSDGSSREHEGVWICTSGSKFSNANASLLQIAYATSSPGCSRVLNVDGESGVSSCGFLVSASAWFWPILLVVGICSMSIGSVLGARAVFHVMTSIDSGRSSRPVG